jgi:hypothetical protein
MRFSKNQPHWGWFMKRLSKILHQQLRKLIRVLNHSIVPIITVLFSICIFASFIPQAQSAVTPPDTAKVSYVKGTVKVHPKGDKTKPTNATLGKKLAKTDALWVAFTKGGNPESLAHLEFFTGGTWVPPIVQAGTDDTNTTYTFPCSRTDVGGAFIGWGVRDGQGRGCEVGFITANVGKRPSSTQPSSAQPSSTQVRVRVERVRDLTLINAYDLNGKLVIDVLVGAVTVQSFESRPVNVEAGNRYIVTEFGQDGTIETINVARLVQSGSIQIFLDPSTWSPDITPLIQQFRQALRLRPAPIPGPTEPPM